MKKALIAVAIALVMVLSYLAGRHHPEPPAPTMSGSARRVLYWVDPMHPEYKSDHPGIAPDCGMQLEPVYAEDAGNTPRVISVTQLPAGGVRIDGATQQLLGIQLATVEKSGGPHIIRLLGRVMPEETRVYRIDAGTEGFVRETYNDSVGELVKKNQKLATSYTGETLAVASGFLAATAGVPGSVGKDGARTVPFPGTVAKQGLSSVQGYTDRLRNLGVSDAQIKEMAENRQLPESVDIVAPADGFILARNIAAGQHFDRSTEFYRIADLSRVWIVADIFSGETQGVRPGVIARVTLPGWEKTVSARVSGVLPEVDPTTRTFKLRLLADNPGFALRPEMYVDVELPVAMPAGVTVPQDAVIDSGREQRVFVENKDGFFEPRPVQTGWRSGDRVQIVSGLAEGDRVVASGTFLVDSESRLKSIAAAGPMQPRDDNTASRRTQEPGLAATAGKVKDAACGMMINASKAAAEGNTITRNGVTYYFCSDRCKKKFNAQPEHYVALNPSGPRP